MTKERGKDGQKMKRSNEEGWRLKAGNRNSDGFNKSHEDKMVGEMDSRSTPKQSERELHSSLAPNYPPSCCHCQPRVTGPSRDLWARAIFRGRKRARATMQSCGRTRTHTRAENTG